MQSNYGSLTEFAAEIERREGMKQDYMVPDKHIFMRTENEINVSDTGLFKMNDVAHGQLAAKLDIPKRYYDKMLQVPGLREENVNSWLKQTGDKHLVRTLDGTARAFLSASYKPMDNFLIMQGALPTLKNIPDLQMRSYSLTDTKMYMQMTIPSMKAEIVPGDVVEYGLTLTNSEVGHGAVNVQSFLYRLVCSNGMVRENILSKRHVGKRLGDTGEEYGLFKQDTILAEMESFKLRFRDVLAAAITDIEFEKHVNQMKIAAGDKVELPETLVKNVTQRFNLTDTEGERILSNMVNDREFSRWGLANGVTALCHGDISIDRQYQYEQIGSDIINLKPNEWEILVA